MKKSNLLLSVVIVGIFAFQPNVYAANGLCKRAVEAIRNYFEMGFFSGAPKAPSPSSTHSKQSLTAATAAWHDLIGQLTAAVSERVLSKEEEAKISANVRLFFGQAMESVGSQMEEEQMREKLAELKRLEDLGLTRRVDIGTRRRAEDEIMRLTRELQDRARRRTEPSETFDIVAARSGLEMSNDGLREKVEKRLVSELERLSTEMDESAYISLLSYMASGLYTGHPLAAKINFMESVDSLYHVMSRSNEWTNFGNDMDVLAVTKLASLGTPVSWTEAAKGLAAPNGFTSDRQTRTHDKMIAIISQGGATPEKIAAVEAARAEIEALGSRSRYGDEAIKDLDKLLANLRAAEVADVSESHPE